MHEILWFEDNTLFVVTWSLNLHICTFQIGVIVVQVILKPATSSSFEPYHLPIAAVKDIRFLEVKCTEHEANNIVFGLKMHVALLPPWFSSS